MENPLVIDCMAAGAVTGFVESKLTLQQLRSIDGLSKRDMVIICIKQSIKGGSRTTSTYSSHENTLFDLIQILVYQIPYIHKYVIHVGEKTYGDISPSVRQLLDR